MIDETASALLARLAESAQGLEFSIAPDSGEAVASIAATALSDAAMRLRDAGFDRLEMVTAVDFADHFELVYRVSSRSLSAAVILKVEVDRDSACAPSVYDVWPAANWQEREIFDLFGIRFEAHPDLRRILLPDDFEGHPLRRDYDDPRVIKRPDYI